MDFRYPTYLFELLRAAREELYRVSEMDEVLTTAKQMQG